MSAALPVVAMRGITKSFGRFRANDGIDIDLHAGEVHGVLGENGAGKSTLMAVLAGLLVAEAGVVEIDGQPVMFASPRDAMASGIQMVQQHFMLVPDLTVGENVVLGPRGGAGWRLDRRAQHAVVQDIGERYGLPLDPYALVGDLPVELQQRVEIVKALHRGSRVLILDEPTAVLTPQEARKFLGVVRSLADAGHAVALVTHRIEEVLDFTDRVTVLRDGRVVESAATAGMSPARLGTMMIGRELPAIDRAETAVVDDTPALELREVSLDVPGMRRLNGLSLAVRPGEIVGVVGVADNGQAELEDVLIGLRRPTAGELCLAGEVVRAATPASVLARGLGYIPGDRTRHGILHALSIEENLGLAVYQDPSFRRRGFLRRSRLRDETRLVMREYGIAARAPAQPAGELSGGNQQKLLLARALWSRPPAIFAVNPTRGLDLGATHDIHGRLKSEAQRGAGVLLMSSDLTEILSLSHRVVVLFDGRFLAEVRPDVGAQVLGQLMAGVANVV